MNWRNQKGFSVVEGLLYLVIVGLLGGVAWYVSSASHNANNTYKAASNANSNSVTKKTVVAPAVPTDWQEYKDVKLGFKVSYPKGWTSSYFSNICSSMVTISAPEDELAAANKTLGVEVVGYQVVLSHDPAPNTASCAHDENYGDYIVQKSTSLTTGALAGKNATLGTIADFNDPTSFFKGFVTASAKGVGDKAGEKGVVQLAGKTYQVRFSANTGGSITRIPLKAYVDSGLYSETLTIINSITQL